MTKAKKPFKTRFAPSPTGYLHLGHGLAALEVAKAAERHNTAMTLRIEDIDQTRCKPVYTEAILEDLKWLGLAWDTTTPIRHQAQHFEDYKLALATLDAMGLIYPCTCTRKDIKEQATTISPEGPLYPGICRDKNLKFAQFDPTQPFAMRLNLEKAIDFLKLQNNWPLYWHDEAAGEQQAKPEMFGDVVLARKDTPTSYHLSVTLDDHLENITHVVRGMDLFSATHIHRVLQALLGFEVPTYHHHQLIMDDDGEKLSKRNRVKPLRELRDEGLSKKDVLALIKDHQQS